MAKSIHKEDYEEIKKRRDIVEGFRDGKQTQSEDAPPVPDYF